MRTALPFFLALALTLAACQPGAPDAGATRTVVDALGRDVDVPTEPRRVIPLAPNLTELAYAAGAGDRIAGISQADDFPPDALAKPRFSSFPLDVEAIVALDPDLILATAAINPPRDAEAFAALGIPTVYHEFASWGDVLAGLAAMGDLLGTPEQAQTVADSLAWRMDALRAQTANLPRPRVLFLIGTETLYTFGKGSYVHDLIEAAGGESLTAEFETAAPVLSDEYVLRAAPDVIVGSFADTLTASGLLAQHPTWDVVPAVQNARIVALDAGHWLRAGPRNILAAEALARALHPALGAEPGGAP